METNELIYNVERAMEHDEEAMAALYNYTYAGAYSLASRLCHDEAVVEDILQESYIAAFSNLKNLNNKANFWRWFRGIVLNKWRDYSKDKLFVHNTVLYEFAENTLESEQLEPSAHDIVEKSQTNDEIRNLVNALPENQRVCVIMFYYEDMKVEEIAKTLDIPVGSVKSRLHYARERLKEEIKEKGLFSTYSIPIVGNAAAQSEIFSKVMATLANAAEDSTAPVVFKTVGSGLLLKLGIGLASMLAVGGIAVAAVNLSKTPEPAPPAATPVTAAVTRKETTTTTTTTAATTTTTLPAATTTTAPQLLVSFDYEEVSGGVAITKYTGNEPNVVIPAQQDGKPVVKIAANAFNSCRVLKSVTIPNSVTEIGDNAFRECPWLSSVKLGKGVKRIGDMAFGGCDSLKKISVPSSVKYIGIYAFAYCDSLESVVISEGTQTLMYCAFYQCPKLSRVTLPASVNQIGRDAFAEADPSLTLFVYDGSYSQEYAEANGINTQLIG